jgi:hypothetical protein
MREKISAAAVATIIVLVSSVIVANWSHVRQVLLAMTADTAHLK